MGAEQGIGRARNACDAKLSTNVYVPHPIANRIFEFKEDTLAAEEKMGYRLVRFDESIRNAPYLKALKRILIRTEGLATVRSDGVEPDLLKVLYLELMDNTGKKSPHIQKSCLRKRFPHDSLESIEASYESFRCMVALSWIDEFHPRENGFTVDDIWKLYNLFMRGTQRERMGGLRNHREETSLLSVNSGVLYVPPNPDRLNDLLTDLVSFCNRESVPPFARSAVEHFQLEAIKPVDVGLDRWGRMIALLLWKQSGMVENVLPPFSLTPALQTQKHTELLIPYQTGGDFTKASAMDALDSWVAHCVRATERSVKFAIMCSEEVAALQKGWRSRFDTVGEDTVLDKLMIELAGFPLITASYAADLTGRTYQTALDAIDKLVDVGVLESLTDGRRNRVFIAHEAFAWMEGVNTRLFPEKPVPREAFLC